MNERKPVVVVLPFPDMKRLHAHSKGTWWEKSDATRNAKELAYHLSPEGCDISGPSTIEYRFFVKDLRNRDEANMIQACKPYVDGLVSAGVIAGDSWKLLHTVGVSVQVERENPRVELVIRSDDAN